MGGLMGQRDYYVQMMMRHEQARLEHINENQWMFGDMKKGTLMNRLRMMTRKLLKKQTMNEKYQRQLLLDK
ncbi:hypothetical protein [Alicyclobacillus dauci]|uniref:Uncharacterized protein n=1 Tax=Alicyclobacillus dauci TaxID=1475485 RepID=A0ABY6Z630_9BACL|nr:hypothetical protein [Alicyclobacillus dauci]WAH38325.1 hypothetical protein NZD86_07550 [Alicyclobacillus dauci]